TRAITELMAMMDVLWPMARYLQLHPDAERQAFVDRLIAELPKYYNPAVQQSTNKPGDTRHDAWYYMENSVLKYGHLYMISGNTVLEKSYRGNLGSAIDMARGFDYLFPQFIGLDKQRAGGRNTRNYSTAGLLAYALIHAYQITGDTAYLVETERALLAMRAVENPFDLLYEPQELTAATAAAAHMIGYAEVIGSDTDFAQLAQDFFYAQAQLLYHNEGRIDVPGCAPVRSAWLPADWRDGMIVPYYNPVERGGINAPAFKENVEAIMFWADYLRFMAGRPEFDPTAPLKILNLNRSKNFYFFSPHIPDEWEREYGPTSLQHIPYEDVDYYDVRPHETHTVREFVGYNGKEIYGAGEVLWAYLLYEALGKAADPHALIVNLNVFDRTYPPTVADRAYMVFNPYAEERTLDFTLTHLDGPHTVIADGVALGAVQPGNAFAITLPSQGSALITLGNTD
ncbi:MAG: hypothetical protein K8S97_00005, partial [Anaerolineae bacterium]|nr:hypothetical protein [Anaerolineae bacterium]